MDARYETFMRLFEEMNYRRTAEVLHLTQPAVTRQIQSLEAELGQRLFTYDRHQLKRTHAARVLADYVASLRYNEEQMRKAIKKEPQTTLRLGATKTIGDFFILPTVEKYLRQTEHNLVLDVDNTVVLLKELGKGKLDLALIEGLFDKSRYAYRLLARVDFVGICAAAHPFAGQTVSFEELFTETIIVREQGSGTRNIFENELRQSGYSLSRFRRCLEIGSFHLINRLIEKGEGVSFAYEPVIAHEPAISSFHVAGLALTHEFNIVTLPHAEMPPAAREFLELLCPAAARQ